jgi:predicted Zn-dependent protease
MLLLGQLYRFIGGIQHAATALQVASPASVSRSWRVVRSSKRTPSAAPAGPPAG